MRWRFILLLGVCACGSSGSSTLLDPTYVSTHTETDVCQTWTLGHQEGPGAVWTAGADACDEGTMSATARTDTIARINMFRGLVELSSASEDLAQRDDDQACAVMMHANDAIDHSPPTTWDCFTDAGKHGASTSNLAIGTSSPADAIDLFMGDNGVESLGHRRWVINFSLGKVGIGFAGNATCLGVFDGSGTSSRDWVAYPPPGPAPIETTTSMWSFHSKTSVAGASVTVHDLGDGSALDVSVHELARGYGADTIAIERKGWTAAAGKTYRVAVTLTGHEPIVYDVSVVSCGG